jgi:anti-sigma-K factor RskA
MTAHDQLDLAAAYALDALDAAEQAAFEAHLVSCEACQTAVDDFRRVNAAIGAAVAAEAPPPDLKARTIAHATGTGGVPPAILPAPPRRRMRPFAPWLAVAAALLLAVGAASYAWWLRADVTALEAALAAASKSVAELRGALLAARQDSVRLMHTLDVMGSPDVLRVDLRGQSNAAPAIGRAYWSRTRGLVFTGEQLPPLPTGRVYQLWVIPPGAGAAPVSAGLFTVDPQGRSSPLTAAASALPTPAVIAVTLEPAGGSPAPTSTPILVGRMSAG